MTNHDSGDNDNRRRLRLSWIAAVAFIVMLGRGIKASWRVGADLARDFNAMVKAVAIVVGLVFSGYIVVKVPAWGPELMRKIAEHLPDRKPAPAEPTAIPKDDKPWAAPLVDAKRTACISESVGEIMEKVGSDEQRFVPYRRRRLCAPGWTATVVQGALKLQAGGWRIWLVALNKTQIQVDTTADVSALEVGDKVRVEGMLTRLEPPGDWFWQHGKVQLTEARVAKVTRQENPYVRIDR